MSARSPGQGRLIWVLLSLPGLALAWLLFYTVFSRVAYPYDLEWMEGGLLAHAARIAAGQGIYVEPSVEFIPYLYTPLYPGLVALFGQLTGIGYGIGRALSILSMVGVLILVASSVVRPARRDLRPAAYCGAAMAVGLFSATYPWVEGWYDIVRADSLFLFMGLGGIAMVRRFANVGQGANGQLQVGAAAAMLALSFFAKQTGFAFVGIGGMLLLFYNWRRLPVYVGVAGTIGLGGTWLLNRATDGWFWTYVFEIHQSHDFNRDRVIASFGHILGRYPAMTAIIAISVVVVLVTAVSKRRLSGSGEALLSWSFVFAATTVLGAISWGTQWAHFNAFIPAMTTGAIAAGLAVPAIIGAIRDWPEPAGKAFPPSTVVGYAVAGILAAQLVLSWWSPSALIPTAEDRRAGDALIRTLASAEGEVFVPYHPWYAHLAGKKIYAHRMGLLDVSVGKKRWPVRGLREAFSNYYFQIVVLDNRPVGPELAGLNGHYRLDEQLDAERQPRVFTGAGAASSKQLLVPKSIWVPARMMAPPPDVKIIENFESGRYEGWKQQGTAWGRTPASGPLPGQGPVSRYGGRYYATSFHGGDDSTGRLSSAEFTVTGSLITVRLSGGRDMERLRAELVVEGEAVREATGLQNDEMRDVTWSVAPYVGKSAVIRLVDEAKGSWGHLNVDEVWMHDPR